MDISRLGDVSRLGGRLAPLTRQGTYGQANQRRHRPADRPAWTPRQRQRPLALGDRKAYFVYRYYVAGKEREVSIGPYPEVSLAEARVKHAALRKTVVVDKRDPVADKRAAMASATSAANAAAKPTFGQCVDAHVAAHAASWRNPKSAEAWRMTLTTYCAPIRDLPVDKVDTEAVAWRPQAAVVASAGDRVAAQGPDRSGAGFGSGRRPHRPGPDESGPLARLARPQAAEPEEDRRTRALRGAPLCRSAGVHDALERDARRRGKGAGLRRPHRRAIRRSAPHDVVRDRSRRGRLDHPGLADEGWQGARRAAQRLGRRDPPQTVRRARQESARVPKSSAAASAVERIADAGMRRLGANATAHGMRASFRMWAADQGVAFEVAEACLAHAVGSAVVQAYQRSSMLERRRPVMDAWAAYVTTAKADKVVSMRRR